MRALPYCFLVMAGGLSLASFLTSQTLAAEAISAHAVLQFFALDVQLP